MELAEGTWWCLRCGSLHFEAGTWEEPSATGTTMSSTAAPPCVRSTVAGADNVAADANLMLAALTHGWRCEPIRLPDHDHDEAWRWSHTGVLGGRAWAIRGEWAHGPRVDDPLRRLMLTTVR